MTLQLPSVVYDADIRKIANAHGMLLAACWQVTKQVAAYVKEMGIQLHNTYSQIHLVGQAQKLIICL